MKYPVSVKVEDMGKRGELQQWMFDNVGEVDVDFKIILPRVIFPPIIIKTVKMKLKRKEDQVKFILRWN